MTADVKSGWRIAHTVTINDYLVGRFCIKFTMNAGDVGNKHPEVERGQLMTDAESSRYAILCLAGLFLGILAVIYFSSIRKCSSAQEKKNLILALVVVGSFMSSFVILFFYEHIVATTVDREIMFIGGGSSLPKQYSEQTSWLDKGNWLGTDGPRGSGGGKVDCANLHRAAGNYSHAERIYLGMFGCTSPASGASVLNLAKYEHPANESPARAFAGLGKVYFITNKPAQAEACYKRAIAMYQHCNPELMAVARNNLAVFYHSRGNAAEAKRLIKIALDESKKNATDDPSIVAQIQSNCDQISQVIKPRKL